MNEEYQWEAHHMQETGVAAGFRLTRSPLRRTVGYLKQGAKKRQGWFVHSFLLSAPITRLPHTMTLDHAQDAAKLILLSLKETA